MKLDIGGGVEITFIQGSLDNPNGAFTVKGRDSSGGMREYVFDAIISPLGGRAGHLKEGEVIPAVELKFLAAI